MQNHGGAQGYSPVRQWRKVVLLLQYWIRCMESMTLSVKPY